MRYVATIESVEHEIEFEEVGGDVYAIVLGETRYELNVQKVGPASFSIMINNRSFDFDVVRDGEETLVASRTGSTRLTLVDPSRRATRSADKRREVTGRAEIKSAMPGRVINVLVAKGDEVKRDQGIIVVEAMKMENEVKSPKAGKVIEVRVTAGQTVEKGELLMVIE